MMVRLESRLVDRSYESELKRAYREHANTRSSLSMLYCAGAILDAMWHEQSLKDLGLDIKLQWCIKTPDSISSATPRCTLANADSPQVWHP